MRLYICQIRVLKTGYLPEAAEDTIEIAVLAKNIKEAIKKASTYRLIGEVRKTIEVVDAKLDTEIDKN